MIDFIQQLLNGLAAGCVYALVTLGFVLVFKATDVVSLAHGELMMLGAFIAYSLIVQFGLSYFVAIPLTLLAMVVIGLLIDRVVIQPMVGKPIFAILMTTLGLGMVIRGLVIVMPGWGTDPVKLPTPISGKTLQWGELVVSGESAAIIVVTAVAVVALYLFFNRTRLGVAMMATAQNPRAATYVGIKVRNIHAVIWGVSAAVAGLAGILLAPLVFVNINMSYLGLKAIPAAVIGGLGSLPGAVLGGMVIGIVESLAGFYLPEGAKDVSAFIVLLVVLAIRPKGLMGISVAKKV